MESQGISFIIDNVGENYSTENIQIFPNPTSELINIRTGNYDSRQDIFMELYNSCGVKVMHISILSPEVQIDISGLAKGIYFLKIVYYDNYLVNKVVIK